MVWRFTRAAATVGIWLDQGAYLFLSIKTGCSPCDTCVSSY